MPVLRLAYATQFLIAIIAIFILWSEVGGQGHLDLLPWYIKLVLGSSAAFAFVRATYFAVARQSAWNGGTLKWGGLFLALLLGCGLATYFAHLYLEEDTDQTDQSITSLDRPGGLSHPYSKCI
jgi:hypothetical protein